MLKLTWRELGWTLIGHAHHTQTHKIKNSIPSPKSHVKTILNYYNDPGDGSEPLPTYVGELETYERPTESLKVIFHDILGEEGRYTLDATGFQIHRLISTEKDFLEDEKIKEYYPETEELLKNVLGLTPQIKRRSYKTTDTDLMANQDWCNSRIHFRPHNSPGGRGPAHPNHKFYR